MKRTLLTASKRRENAHLYRMRKTKAYLAGLKQFLANTNSMKQRLLIFGFLSLGVCTSHADNLSFDWEVVNTNLLPLVDNGAFRQGQTTLGPFLRNVTLQQITVGVSMAPTPGWPDPNGFAEALTFGIVNGAASPAAFLQSSQQWGPFNVSPGALFMKNLKIWYNNGGGLNQDITVPLYDLAVSAGQSIALVIQYYSADVASDVEMGGTLTYK